MFQMDYTINKELLKAITPSSETYDRELAFELALEWANTDEKWMFITDHFEILNDHDYAEILVDRIETIFEKLLGIN